MAVLEHLAAGRRYMVLMQQGPYPPPSPLPPSIVRPRLCASAGLRARRSTHRRPGRWTPKHRLDLSARASRTLPPPRCRPTSLPPSVPPPIARARSRERNRSSCDKIAARRRIARPPCVRAHAHSCCRLGRQWGDGVAVRRDCAMRCAPSVWPTLRTAAVDGSRSSSRRQPDPRL